MGSVGGKQKRAGELKSGADRAHACLELSGSPCVVVGGWLAFKPDPKQPKTEDLKCIEHSALQVVRAQEIPTI